MTDLTHILGKPFRPGARGPDAYDCVGVAAEVVRIELGEAAAETMPGGAMTSIETEDFPGEWVRVADEPSRCHDADVVLTERVNKDGDIEHHLYAAVALMKFATSDRGRGVCIVPIRAIQDEVIGVYRYGGVR